MAFQGACPRRCSGSVRWSTLLSALGCFIWAASTAFAKAISSGRLHRPVFVGGTLSLLRERLPGRPGLPAGGKRRVPKLEDLEPFAFDVLVEDHCETPTNAYRYIVPLLRDMACRRHPGEHFREASSKFHIYDPFYCLGGSKRRLGKMGFTSVHNQNEDFFEVVRRERTVDFDVLVTNPPFSSPHYISGLMDFCRESRKPWMTILPARFLFSDVYNEALHRISAEFPHTPFYIVPKKKFHFKTPAPLPKPPVHTKQKARGRSRLGDTVWSIHSGQDPQLHDDLISVARKTSSEGSLVAESILDLPRSAVPPKFTEEMLRNAELMGYPLG